MSLNQCIHTGRLTNDPEVRYTQGEKPTAIANYTIAVDRRFKRDGEPTADFVRLIAFGKNAEFAEKYLKKGMKIEVVSHFQSGSYTNKDGQKVYTNDFIVDTQGFAESKNASQGNGSAPASGTNNSSLPSDGFMSIPDGVDEGELPFS